MKRVDLIAILLGLVVGMAAFSCKKDVDAAANGSEEKGYSELMRVIAKHDSLYSQPAITGKTRGRVWKAICKCFKVVAADIEGGVAGARAGNHLGEKIALGVAGAISSSADAAEREFGASVQSVAPIVAKLQSKEQAYGNDVTGSTVGLVHNSLMKELFAGYQQSSEEFRVRNDHFNDVIALMEKHGFSNELTAVNKKKLHALRNTVSGIRADYSQLSDDEAYEKLKRSPRGSVEEMSIISTYALHVSQIKDKATRGKYAEEFSNIVKASGIPEDSKVNILIGTSTAINSLTLWEE